MSDDYIFVVPRDPRYVPPLEVQRRLVEVLERVAPGAEDISVNPGVGELTGTNRANPEEAAGVAPVFIRQHI
jgi:hypothetical protein